MIHYKYLEKALINYCTSWFGFIEYRCIEIILFIPGLWTFNLFYNWTFLKRVLSIKSFLEKNDLHDELFSICNRSYAFVIHDKVKKINHCDSTRNFTYGLYSY